jgi:uncharacterized protein
MPQSESERERLLRSILARDAARLALLAKVEALGLPDCWIAAGFVRAAVWDALHDRPAAAPTGDIDVIWFDAARATADEDRTLELRLHATAPGHVWSVKNQARMHLRNGDAAYASCKDAMRYWPETATSVAARLSNGEIETLAPFGLGDLLGLVVRPTPTFAGKKHNVFRQRLAQKRWLEIWPQLRVRKEA